MYIKRNLGLEAGQTEPGLVAFYDIWPGNGAGIFLQPRSPHGAHVGGTQNFGDSGALPLRMGHG